MADIVERLRAENSVQLARGLDLSDVLLDAANEIERLRAERDAARAEAARLREALRLADAALSGAHMNMSAVEKKVRAALAKEPGHE